jgi:hypothetical protein
MLTSASGWTEDGGSGLSMTRATTTVDANDLPVSDPPLCCWSGSISGRTRLLAMSSGSLSLSRGLFEIWFKEYLCYPSWLLNTTPMLLDESGSVLEAYLDENMLPD